MERNLNMLKRPALLEIAKKAKLKGYSRLKRAELVKLLKESKDVDVSVKDKNKKKYDNRVYVNVYCSEAHVERTGAPSTQRFVSEHKEVERPRSSSSQPAKKFPSVQTAKPIKKIEPVKISAKAQKAKDIIASELKTLPRSKISSDFKSTLEALFRK
jgi:hypothetical protein